MCSLEALVILCRFGREVKYFGQHFVQYLDCTLAGLLCVETIKMI
jgi:hypothetical protein